ncbi:MAG: hypothetical protein U0414_28540 [Polyangiaceae bacterium]
MTFKPLAITATAATTCVGSNAEQTAASIRAGLIGTVEHASFAPIPGAADEEDDAPSEPERLVVGAVVDPALHGAERLIALLGPTVKDLLESAGLEPRELPKAALLLSLPAADECVEGWELERVGPEVSRAAGVSFKTTRRTASGHPGVLALLEEVGGLFDAGDVDACVVAGVDSYLDEARLGLLDRAERLHTRRIVDGFVPGEAACALLIEAPRRLRGRGGRAELVVTSIARGSEPNAFAGSNRQSTASGLTESVRGALGGAAPAWLIDDQNGDRYRAFEWGVATTRLAETLASVTRVDHVAASTGDVGAATGGIQIALAAAAHRRGWCPNRRGEALVTAASDGALRVAARLSAPANDG